MQTERLPNAYETAAQRDGASQPLGEQGQPVPGRFLTVEDIAKLLHCSSRTIHELTRTCRIPHRRIGGTRRCLFILEEVDAWMDGADLYVSQSPRGGRVVRPKP
jgi:excisionase family DNA binding protein